MVNKDRIQKFLHRVRFQDLSRDYLIQLVELAQREDLQGAGLADEPTAQGDITSRLLGPSARGTALLVAREPLVACGIPLVPIILECYSENLKFDPATSDGCHLSTGQHLGTIRGSVSDLLTAERVVLNFVQFLSGVASETKIHVDALGDSTTRLLDTRKTTPGFRMLQKYAVACGGGWNHRLGLFDRVMLKDNHLAASHSPSGQALTDLINLARTNNVDLLIEVEVDQLDQIPAVLAAQPDKILLDNFSDEEIKQAVALIDERTCTEATGGITLERLQKLGNLGLDFVSTGALVHKAVWKDIGLDWTQ